MIKKLKYIVIFEAIIIIILIALIINLQSQVNKKPETKIGLLAPRVYAEVLKPKSYLITNFKPLKQDLVNYLGENNSNVAIYIQNLRSGANMGIHENTAFLPLSLNKLPIAITIMEEVENDQISLDTMIPIRQSDKINTYGYLYKNNKTELPLKILLEEMVKESDNTALNVLLRYIDQDHLNLLLEYYSIDLSAYYSAKVNYEEHSPLVTPKTMANVFTSLYLSTILEAKDSEYLLSLLTNTTFNVGKIANLPQNITIAHKFGVNYLENNKLFSDCGIMYIEDMRISYCIMTKNMTSEKALETIGVIVNKIYYYIIDEKEILNQYKENPNNSKLIIK